MLCLQKNYLLKKEEILQAYQFHLINNYRHYYQKH